MLFISICHHSYTNPFTGDAQCVSFLLYSFGIVTTQFFGLAVSYLFVFGILGFAGLLLRTGLVSSFTSRKIVHIGVSHWWFIAVYFFEHTFIAVIGPLSFVALNYISYRKHLFAAMEDPEHEKNLGTVYFPIALLILVLWSWAGELSFTQGGVAMAALGYGDGLAALAGRKLGHTSFQAPGGHKTFVGVAVMMVAVFSVSAFLIAGANTGAPVLLTAGIIALVATSTEIMTPWGLDNLTIPLVTAMVTRVVLPL